MGLFETGAQKDHEDLDGRFLQESFTTGATNHGTHVAGIIGAISDNDTGISGIAAVQFLLLDRNDFVVSIARANSNNVPIINASFLYLNSDGTNAPYNSSHAAAISNYTGLIICSAGNDGNNTDNNPQYPAGYSTHFDNVISVGAINEDGNRRGTSNFGANSVNLFAPGGLIHSTLPNDTYGDMSGTSMAAPHVTGTAALLKSYNSSFTPFQIKWIIENSVDKITSIDGLCVTDGIVNAYNALRSASTMTRVFNNFGYNGSTYYWNGKVDMLVSNENAIDSSNPMVFSESTMLSFWLDTKSSSNAWSVINGTVSFQLKHDSTDTIVQIGGSDTHVSTVNVNLLNNVSLGNTSFTINTEDLLPGTHSYTLETVKYFV